MSREALLALVQERLGLDPGSLGERVLSDACAEARHRFGVADDEALFRRVQMDADAFAECAESFTVPESWFFRASEQFGDLVRFAGEHSGRRPFRVLSLPSAAGEEAWSAAIALLEAGYAPGDFDILGIDVSRVAVRRAQEGIYRRSAFRGQPPPIAWLHPTSDGHYQVDPLLRRCVRFRVGNALDPMLLQGEPRFDAAFCRNLLIYLHGAARRQLLDTLVAALTPPALVLAGQAEVLANFDDRLLPWPGGSPLTFRYTGRPALASTAIALEPVATEARAALLRSPPRESLQPLPPTAGATTATTTSSSPSAAAPPAAAEADPIGDAHRLADAGHVDQARAVCIAHLSVHPEDVGALYLLGLVESAAGDNDAADRAFTRVLYLDRTHLDALEQRIGLAERRGAREQAADLRARAARMRDRSRPRGSPA